MNNWRPNDWKQPYKFPAEFGNISDYDFAYEHGASNMLEALIARMGEKCPHVDFNPLRDMGVILRKDCPQCWQELKGR